MMDNISVFEVEVLRMGTEEVLKKIHLLAQNTLQASHIIVEYLYGNENSEFRGMLVEIGSIKKLAFIKSIINPEFILDMDDDIEEYDGSEPISMADSLGDEDTMSFVCQCHERLKTSKFQWPFVICPNCENKILRSEVKEAGGLYFYEKKEK